MSEKKNIDRLFQERFKDFEAEPSEHVWKNIEAALKEDKKDRKVIPFWWRLSGVAAALVIGFFLVNSAFDADANPENPVVIENDGSTLNPNDNPVVNSTNTSEGQKNENGVVKSDAVTPENKNSDTDNVTKTTSSSSEKAVVVVKSGDSKIKNQKAITTDKNAIASESNPKGKKQKKSGTISEKNATDAIANGKDQKQNSTENKSEIANNAQKQNAKSENKEPFINQNTGVVNQETQKEFIKNNISTDNLPKANNNGVVSEKSAEDKKLDSTGIATVVPNALEELLKENEKEKKMIAETNVNRWQITSSVAPIYFSSTTNGSPIDAQFAENNKTYENNLSFGLGVNYAVSKKISLRTGVNKLTLGYNTNDVSFSAGLQGRSFANIAPSPNATTLEVVNEDVAGDGLLPFESELQNMNNGAITQRMGYIELPVEMSYKLVDKKFGVTLIGGMSTLFLNENSVALMAPGLSTNLGKASNLNDVHFSSNIGVGFKYSFWKSFEVNFEPMFKYQINTFSKDAGNFKPYFIGLYSGVSFNF